MFGARAERSEADGRANREPRKGGRRDGTVRVGENVVIHIVLSRKLFLTRKRGESSVDTSAQLVFVGTVGHYRYSGLPIHAAII